MEKKKISTRDAYGNALIEFANEYKNMVVLDADLVGATKTGLFQKEYPNRHFDCGIAEANMMCVAAGLATEGFIPVVSSFAIFAAGRCYEQVRNSIGYPRLNVKIVATHGGISVGEDGATHQSNEDLALMRSIPGMMVLSPSDAIETRLALKSALDYVGPVYIRLGRAELDVFNDNEEYNFSLGKGVKLADGNDVTLISTGLPVYETLKSSKLLNQYGITADVINIHTIKPIDAEIIINSARKTGKVVVIEEHSIIGGLGEAVASVLAENNPVQLLKIGVPDIYGHSATAKELLDEIGLTSEKIYEKVVDWLKK